MQVRHHDCVSFEARKAEACAFLTTARAFAARLPLFVHLKNEGLFINHFLETLRSLSMEMLAYSFLCALFKLNCGNRQLVWKDN